MLRLALLCALVSTAGYAFPLHGPCAPTAEAAVAKMLEAAVDAGIVTGFRVEHVHVDAVRGEGYALVGRCGGSSEPLTAVKLPTMRVKLMTNEKTTLIHPGDALLVLKVTNDTHLQLEGRAEGAGAVGQEIMVRLTDALVRDGVLGAKLRCRVKSAGVVEVLP
ncbi:hypothetical protein ACFQBQ_01590 [Granulicella cerasi]|uniref:Flagella basal body P-ring formation protein FlgA C-terminal domain-containing protein n=1 Tax=Granulicella cerasi TaxID=741063 RepID=A0ABW1Z818_9BACT|nr:hypothetical protein [Granulicella cerasi]